MPLVYSAFVPHPPIVVPEIGRGEEAKCSATLEAYRVIARNLVQAQVETVLLISPHAALLRNGVTLLSGDELFGDFSAFGVPEVKLSYPGHRLLTEALAAQLPEAVLHLEKLDHGALVPLYFLQEAGWQGKLVEMSMPQNDPERYGQKIGSILKDFTERIALIASGDLSHRLKEDGPYGLHPSGPKLDQWIVKSLAKDPSEIKRIPEKLAEEGGECGWRSLRLALSVQEGMPKILSYEGPFGVGYLVAELYHASLLPAWARLCLETYLKEGSASKLTPPEGEEFQRRRACFVTLKKEGELRGCIGTTEPWQDNLALEIQQNVISAGTQDPRFWPVELEEMSSITISVDVLGEMEKIGSLNELDPWRYGVVVRGRGRTGLLLPHLEGINTAEEQVNIAKQKAGLPLEEPVEMWRFEVVRYFE